MIGSGSNLDKLPAAASANLREGLFDEKTLIDGQLARLKSQHSAFHAIPVLVTADDGIAEIV
jgi:hypothetical protein